MNKIGFGGLLGLLFIALKLVGVIDWSWWWVTLPLWGVSALGLLLIALGGLISFFVDITDRRAARKREARKC